jgi:hypothetical protein
MSSSLGKTLGETLAKLKERWGEHDSDFLLSSEVRTMSPEERKEYLSKIVDLYLQANSEKTQKQSSIFYRGNYFQII